MLQGCVGTFVQPPNHTTAQAVRTSTEDTDDEEVVRTVNFVWGETPPLFGSQGRRALRESLLEADDTSLTNWIAEH